MRGKWWAPAGFAAAALVLAACGSSPSSPSSSSGGNAAPSSAAASSTTLKTTTIHGKSVLTNSQGMVLYMFAPDTATKSHCNSTCLKYWPPVKGPATAGSGVTGTLSVITTNGVKQATYDGHPLYTYVGDTSPGMDKGNGLNLSGGLWWVITPSGAKLTKVSSGSSGGSSSGGTSSGGSGSGMYGY